MTNIFHKIRAKLKRVMARINNDDPRNDPVAEIPGEGEVSEEVKRLREEARQNRVRVYAGY